MSSYRDSRLTGTLKSITIRLEYGRRARAGETITWINTPLAFALYQARQIARLSGASCLCVVEVIR